MKEDCQRYYTCNAPLCPLDENKEQVVWYKDEYICSRTDFKLKWISNQKKIKKRTKISSEYFFTVKMLNFIDRINNSIKGIDADNPISESTWCKRYKEQHKKAQEQYKNSELYKSYQEKKKNKG